MRWSALAEGRAGTPRDWVAGELAVLGGSAQYGALDGLLARAARHADGGTATYAGRGDGGYGALRPGSDGLLLPPRFRAVVLAAEGAPLPSGEPTPAAVAAMGVLADAEGVVLACDHVAQAEGAASSGVATWDELAPGRTTLLRLATDGSGAPRVTSGEVALSGVLSGGGGGVTPWGTWLSAERLAFGTPEGWRAEHGWVFEVPVDAPSSATPASALGRFARAGMAVDATTGTVYQCEAGSAGRLWRFEPVRLGNLAGGRSQHLIVRERGEPLRPGRSLIGEWVHDGAVTEDVALAGLLGCRLVGGVLWLHGRGGRLWEYRPAGGGGLLRLVADGLAAPLADLPVVTPRYGLLLAEPAPCGTPSLHGVTLDGRTVPLAQSADGATWRAPTFSPDGRLLFVALAGGGGPARILAIWGPWEDGCL